MIRRSPEREPPTFRSNLPETAGQACHSERMRSTCSLYVDAGYLLASAATRVTGTSLRSGIHVDYAELINALVETAKGRSGLPVLRVHWYDSARNGVPDAQ